jgi:hypothetical protein
VTEAEAREGIEILDEALSAADAYCTPSQMLWQVMGVASGTIHQSA